jgi:polyisoprenoid-binding protein YceI
MKNRLFTLALAVSVLALATAAVAETVPYKIDPAHSQVGFSVKHFFSKTPGRFNDYEGIINLDQKNLANSSVDVTIQTTSIYTNQEKRDAHLRSADFFDAEKYPTLTFKSTKVVPGEGDKFKIEGNLTMRGVTKPVVLDAEFLGAGDIGINGQTMNRAGFAATTTVNRKDYGINWNKTLDQGGMMLGDDVAITLNVEGFKWDAAAQAAMQKAQAARAAAAEKDKAGDKTVDKK